MVRERRTLRKPKTKKKEEYDSDDPGAYKDMPVPDKNSSDYTEDKVDQFHNERISKLLASGVQELSDPEDNTDDEEVMALGASSSEEEDDDEEEDKEEEDMDSDLDRKKDEGLPNDMAWGNLKKMYYDSDYVTKGKSQEEKDVEDKEEEEEARNIQRRLVSDLTEDDYDLHLFQELAVEEVEKSLEKERIQKDLRSLSHKEKMKMLKKEAPELLELIQDFKAKMTELKDKLQPLMEMVKDGRIPAGKGADYLRTKQQLYLNYCTNISFYLVLKAKRLPAHSHPVIERLVTYRNLINNLGTVDERLAPQLRSLLSGARKATVRPGSSENSATSRKLPGVGEAAPERSVGSGEESDMDEEAALRFYRSVERRLQLKRTSQEPQAEEELLEEGGNKAAMDAEAKRKITYQMSKNKGLTPKRKKIDRNPRVKHREKFRRAKIRRKGQVREVRREDKKYSGELSGIRAGVKKSIKLM